jgi:GNAT superfamily N-acetyltransferase
MTGPRRQADPDRDGTVYTYDLAHDPAAPSLPGAVLRVATRHDNAALQQAMHASGAYPNDVVETRLRDGRRPYIVETDGKIVSYGWVAFDAEPIGDLGFSFQLKDDETYIYDCATRPDYRGRGYYPALLRAMAMDLRHEGYKRLWIGTAPGNIVSQRGIARAGFLKVADVHIKLRADGEMQTTLHGVPGVPPDLLAHAAWAMHGQALPGTGIPQDIASRQ